MSRPDPDDRPTPAVGRLALRIEEVAAALGLSRRSLERLRSLGQFPPPDRVVGRMKLWRPETIDAWLAKGGR